MKIICLGDSLTYGYKVSLPHKWTYILGKYLNDEIINKGVLGDSTSGMLFRFYEDVLIEKPDKVLIMGGTNDMLMGVNINNILNNIFEMYQDLKKNNIECILCVQPPVCEKMASNFWVPNINYGKINFQIKNLNSHIKRFSYENNLLNIDFYTKFINYFCKANENINEFYIDGIHLNSKGHRIMAKLAYDIIKQGES